MLAELAKYQNVENVIQAAYGKEIPAILSVQIMRNGIPMEVMPDEVENKD